MSEKYFHSLKVIYRFNVYILIIKSLQKRSYTFRRIYDIKLIRVIIYYIIWYHILYIIWYQINSCYYILYFPLLQWNYNVPLTCRNTLYTQSRIRIVMATEMNIDTTIMTNNLTSSKYLIKQMIIIVLHHPHPHHPPPLISIAFVDCEWVCKLVSLLILMSTTKTAMFSLFCSALNSRIVGPSEVYMLYFTLIRNLCR